MTKPKTPVTIPVEAAAAAPAHAPEGPQALPDSIEFEAVTAQQLSPDLAPILVVGMCRDGQPALATPLAGTETTGQIAAVAKQAGFPGKLGDAQIVSCNVQGLPHALLLVGLGERERLDRLSCERGFAQAAKLLRGGEFPSVAALPALENDLSEMIGPVVDGFVLGSYSWSKYLSEDARKKAQPVTKVFILAEGTPEEVEGQLEFSKAAAAATNVARDLANTPGADLPPPAFADKINALVRQAGLHCEIWKRKRIEAAGMNLLLAVGNGSLHEPRFIKLTYKPEQRATKTVILVGKGITFDTGGLDIKKPLGMESMKGDKSGAAAVVAAMMACSRIKPPCKVIGLIASAENMPSGKAYRPGDVFKSAAGKTVEVGDTDAEGRLVLADALHYASTLEGECIVDLATLTGSCVVALGPQVSGIFANDDELAEQILGASDMAGERIWPLPLELLYRSNLESDVADLRSVGPGRYGDAINAAVFLREFVGGRRWAHLDIAGPAWADEPTAAYPSGATGFGVRTLCHFLLDQK